MARRDEVVGSADRVDDAGLERCRPVVTPATEHRRLRGRPGELAHDQRELEPVEAHAEVHLGQAEPAPLAVLHPLVVREGQERADPERVTVHRGDGGYREHEDARRARRSSGP